MFWSRRSKRISLGRTWLKQRCFGRAGRNVSRSVELGRNLDILVVPVETYLAWSNLVELGQNIKVLSRRSKRNSLSRTWSKPRYFGRAGRNLFCLLELGQNIETRGRADQNIPRLVELGLNLDVLVVPIETYLAWSNLLETQMFWSRRSKRIFLGQTGSKLVETKTFWSRRSKRISLRRTWSKHRCFGRTGRIVSHWVELGRLIEVRGCADRNKSRSVELDLNLDVLIAPFKTYLSWSKLVET